MGAGGGGSDVVIADEWGKELQPGSCVRDAKLHVHLIYTYTVYICMCAFCVYTCIFVYIYIWMFCFSQSFSLALNLIKKSLFFLFSSCFFFF